MGQQGGTEHLLRRRACGHQVAAGYAQGHDDGCRDGEPRHGPQPATAGGCRVPRREQTPEQHGADHITATQNAEVITQLGKGKVRIDRFQRHGRQGMPAARLDAQGQGQQEGRHEHGKLPHVGLHDRRLPAHQGVGQKRRRAQQHGRTFGKAGQGHDDGRHGAELRGQDGQPGRDNDHGGQGTAWFSQKGCEHFRHGHGPAFPYFLGQKQAQHGKAHSPGAQPPEGRSAHLPGQTGHAHGGGTAHAGGHDGKGHCKGRAAPSVKKIGGRVHAIAGGPQGHKEQDGEIEDQKSHGR